MPQIDRAFVAVGLACLIIGMLLGFYMGVRGDNMLLTVHVAILLTGFLVLTLYGVIYRLWPEMKSSALANVQFWTAVAGAAGIIAGTVQIALGGGVVTAAAGSVLAIVGALLMGWLFLFATAGETQRETIPRARNAL